MAVTAHGSWCGVVRVPVTLRPAAKTNADVNGGSYMPRKALTAAIKYAGFSCVQQPAPPGSNLTHKEAMAHPMAGSLESSDVPKLSKASNQKTGTFPIPEWDNPLLAPSSTVASSIALPTAVGSSNPTSQHQKCSNAQAFLGACLPVNGQEVQAPPGPGSFCNMLAQSESEYSKLCRKATSSDASHCASVPQVQGRTPAADQPPTRAAGPIRPRAGPLRAASMLVVTAKPPFGQPPLAQPAVPPPPSMPVGRGRNTSRLSLLILQTQASMLDTDGGQNGIVASRDGSHDTVADQAHCGAQTWCDATTGGRHRPTSVLPPVTDMADIRSKGLTKGRRGSFSIPRGCPSGRTATQRAASGAVRASSLDACSPVS
jgi:hypothetical protein